MNPLPKYNEKGELDTRLTVDPVTGDVGIGTPKLETKDKPVAWGMETDGLIYDVICPAEHEREEGEYTIPLYTHPKEWSGLTSDDMKDERTHNFDFIDGARWAETKLKEKNT